MSCTCWSLDCWSVDCMMDSAYFTWLYLSYREKTRPCHFWWSYARAGYHPTQQHIAATNSLKTPMSLQNFAGAPKCRRSSYRRALYTLRSPAPPGLPESLELQSQIARPCTHLAVTRDLQQLSAVGLHGQRQIQSHNAAPDLPTYEAYTPFRYRCRRC